MQQRWGSISYSNHLQLDVFLPLLLMFMFIEILFGFCRRKNIKNYEVLFQKVDIFPILRLSIQETPEYIEGSFCVFLMIKNSEQKSRRMFLLNMSPRNVQHLQHYLWYCVFYAFNTQMSFSNRRIMVTVRFN